MLRKIADMMREKKDVIAKWLTLEVGKPLAEAVGEVGGGADIFEWNAEETKEFMAKHNKVDFQILEFMFIINPWELLQL